MFSVRTLRKIGAFDAPVTQSIKASDSPIEILFAVRANEKLQTMDLVWDVTPKIGDPETIRQTLPLLPVYPGAGGVWYRTVCSTCDRRAQHIHWIGRRWVCKQCLNSRPYETMRRRDPIYSRRKMAKRAREVMGCPGPLLSPIIVSRSADRDLADKLYQAEMQIFANAAAGLSK